MLVAKGLHAASPMPWPILANTTYRNTIDDVTAEKIPNNPGTSYPCFFYIDKEVSIRGGGGEEAGYPYDP